MTRRATVAALVAVLCTVAATVHAEPASAYYDAILTEADWATVDNWLRSQADPAELVTNAERRTRWSRIKLAGGYGWGGLAAPAGVTLPTLAVAAGGLAFGWEIGHASGLSDWASGKLLGLGSNTNTGTITAGTWQSYTCPTGGGVNDFNPCVNMGYAVGDKVWVLQPTGSGCATNYATTSWESAWNIDFTCSSANNANLLTYLQAVASSAPGAYVETGDCTSSASTNDCYGVFYGFTQLLNRATVNEARAYNATTDAQNKTATIASVPRQTSADYGSARADAAEDAIEDDEVLGPAIGTILHPSTDTGGDASEALLLPQPRYNETATAYRTRLRALGFLGTITLSANAGAGILPEFGPQVVTEIQVETSTGTEIYPLLSPWPEPPPTLMVPGTSTEITVEYNPDTAPQPAPGDPGSADDPPPGNAPPPGGGGTITVGDCECPAPDFSPITNVGYGDKFPFGVVGMVTGLLGTTLYSSPDAPSFTFDFSDTSTPVGTYDLGEGTMDLNVLDPYASTMRTLTSWALWIGGLWWFGSRWFGFKGGGDPGEVVDEVWS